MKKRPGRPTGFRQPRRPTRKPLAERGGGDGGGLQNSCRARESNTLFGPACQEKFSPPGMKLLSGRGKRARMSFRSPKCFRPRNPGGTLRLLHDLFPAERRGSRIGRSEERRVGKECRSGR